MIICPVCGHQNEVGNRTCPVCGTKLAMPALPKKDPVPPTSTGSLLAQLNESRQQLEQARKESSHLAELLTESDQGAKKLQQELDAIRNNGSPTMPTTDPALDQLRKQMESVNAENLKLESELARQAGSSGVRPPISRTPMIVGGLVLASLSAFGGFRYGQRGQDPKLRQQQQLVAAELQTTKDKVKDLQSQLDAARKDTADIRTQAGARAQELKDANARATRLQHQLSATQYSLEEKTHSETNARQQLQAATQNTSQLSQQLAAKTGEVASLQQVLGRHPGWTYKGPAEGIITWTGEIPNKKDKKDTPESSVIVTIDHGQVTIEPPIGSFSSDHPLPGVPIVLQPLVKEACVVQPRNAKNGSGKAASFRITGKGKVTAKVAWMVQ
jgi:predicted  nucleic acid-binding Zn-ribbon protein